MASIFDWSTTFANNGTADGDVPWPEGMARRQVNDSARGIMGRVAALLGDIGGALSAGGTANGLTVTANSAFTTYANGQIIAFRATASNTGAATLSVNAIGAKAIRKMTFSGEAALDAGDIQNTGIYVAQYSTALNSAAGGWLLVNPTVSSLTLNNLTLTSTDAGAAAGPVLTLYRNSASPAASDVLGQIVFDGEDSAGNQQTYGDIRAILADPTSGSEYCQLLLRNTVAGVLTTQITLTTTGAQIPAIGASTPGTGAFTTLSASGLFSLSGDQVQISEGGTGASTAAAARTALFGVSTTVDNTIPRYDGTTGQIQTSGVTISDSNVFSGGAWNGTVGATTPAAGTFTTVTASGNITAENFVDASAFAVLANDGTSGGVILRPGGVGSVTGQFQVATGGAITANGAFSTTGNISTTATSVTAASDFLTSGTQVRIGPGSAGTIELRPNTVGSLTGAVSIGVSGTTVGGTVTATNFITTSDADLKQDIHPLDSAAEALDAICAQFYKWKDTGREALGFVIDDNFEKAAPWAVTRNAEGVRQLNIIPMLAYLWNAVREKK